MTTSTSYLANIESRLSLDRVSCWSVVGSPRTAICAEAVQQSCDLIVLACSPELAEGLVRESPCPVLLIRLPAPERAGFQNVLVPIDGSPESLEVHLLLKPYLERKARVTLLTASGLTAQDPDYGLARERLQRYMTRLAEELGPLSDQGLDIQVQLVDGEPAAAILSWARQEEVDLIAMCSHGHSSMRSFFMGSVTRDVLHQASCAVLLSPVPRSD